MLPCCAYSPSASGFDRCTTGAGVLKCAVVAEPPFTLPCGFCPALCGLCAPPFAGERPPFAGAAPLGGGGGPGCPRCAGGAIGCPRIIPCPCVGRAPPDPGVGACPERNHCTLAPFGFASPAPPVPFAPSPGHPLAAVRTSRAAPPRLRLAVVPPIVHAASHRVVRTARATARRIGRAQSMDCSLRIVDRPRARALALALARPALARPAIDSVDRGAALRMRASSRRELSRARHFPARIQIMRATRATASSGATATRRRSRGARATRDGARRRARARCDATGRRETMIALAGALAVTAPRRADAAGQPIDWLMQSTFDEDVDLVEIIKASAKGDAAAGSESWRREAAEKRRETAKEKATTTTDEEREPADVGKTATKFGKLGVILVLADVVTAAVMGKSVLGVAKSLEREMELDENGEVVEVKKVESGDWKDGIADKLMDRIKENQRIAEKGAEESED